jgi:hypothetical protein
MAEDDKKSASRVDDESATVVPKEAEPATTDNTEIVYPKGVELVVIIVALCLAVLLVALDQTIIATAIPRITDHFNSVQDIGWYGSVSTAHFMFEEVSIEVCIRLIF